MLEMPETTLRLLREEFNDLVPVLGEGRRRRYADDGAAVLRQIVEWRRAGWSSARIREEMLRTHGPRETIARRVTDQQVTEIAARLATHGADIALLRVEVGALRQEITRLIDVLRAAPVPTVQSVLDNE